MDDNKITISWDELRTRQVEQRVSAMQAMRRNREYAEVKEAAAEEPRKFKSLWYNAAVYMTIFGLFGGLFAWTCGTILRFKNSDFVEANVAKLEAEEVRTAADAGKLSVDERAQALNQIALNWRKNPYVQVYLNETLSNDQKKKAIEQIGQRDKGKAFVANVLVFGVSGLIIAMMLSIADPLVSRNYPSAIINGSVGATLGLIGGVIVAIVAEKLYRALGGVDGSITTSKQLIARCAQWSIVGLFLSLAPGLVMRNAKKFIIGAIGGLVGGAVGGLMFDLVDSQAHQLGWLVGLCSIGVVAALASALVESASKSGWLKVTQGLIAGKQFILYRNPTFIGSSPDNQIYLFKDANVGRRHAAIHIVKGGFELEDLPLGVATMVNGRPITRARLRTGDQIQVGGTRFIFQEKQPSTFASNGNGNRH